ncbi:hypothetical protein SAY87_022930 [Trapa incisa]|uniref:Uncharacterized protein n=1 Tax=Trapa incisa TaxID=236973 RepID=A0AAN7Q686_9MYRT|nr:hypothetical protein SAY87_022930 [Trapa incisa]
MYKLHGELGWVMSGVNGECSEELKQAGEATAVARLFPLAFSVDDEGRVIEDALGSKSQFPIGILAEIFCFSAKGNYGLYR